MENTKKSLVHIISSHPNGVPLSQLPRIYLKKNHFALKVQEFGYKKLKEFLQSISEVEISSEGFTHLKRKPIFDKENLAEIISGIIKEKEFGVTESILQATLQARINDSID